MHARAGRLVFTIMALMLSLTFASCGGGGTDNSGGNSPPDGSGDFSSVGDCTPVVAAVSSEKVNLFTELAAKFKNSPEGESLNKCAAIVPIDVSSGEAARLLKLDWPEAETDKPKPVIWSPASTSWVAQVADSVGPAVVPDPVSFARTPVVFAMPEIMAKTLGWPKKSIGFKDLHDLCLDPKGWGKFGGTTGLWGSFKLGKTNPNTSTTGLNTLLMQNYAAAGKKTKLSAADVQRGTSFSRDFESCVIHYGDTTGNVLNRIYERAANGQSLDYVSAVAVEETSVINYNRGNPTSRVVAKGDQLTPPKERLVAIYPKEGSLESDNPVVVLGNTADVNWVTPEQRKAGEAFKKFVLTAPAQAVLGEYGFRPVDPKAKPTGQVTRDNGVDPAQPKFRLPNPDVAVVSAAVRQWEDVRKGSSVLELIDLSGSMDEEIETGRTRLDGAKESAKATLGHFRSTDELGLWVFSTEISSNIGKNVVPIRQVGPLGGGRETLEQEIDKLQSVSGTPLYDALATAHRYMQNRAKPGRINAIIVLSDGEDKDSRISLDDLKRQLRGPTEGNDPAPVRVFPIIYGQDAPPRALEEIAEESGGQVFNASDPRRIKLVFQQVVNNF